MTDDDRSLERAARSWLENGPAQAPARAVEAALLRIETTPQERDLRIPRRFTEMSMPVRVATAAVIGVLAVGGAFYSSDDRDRSIGGPGPSVTASPPTSAPASGSVPPSSRRPSRLPGRARPPPWRTAGMSDLSETTDVRLRRGIVRIQLSMDPASMTGATEVEFLPGHPATGKAAGESGPTERRSSSRTGRPPAGATSMAPASTGSPSERVLAALPGLRPDCDQGRVRPGRSSQSWLEIRTWRPARRPRSMPGSATRRCHPRTAGRVYRTATGSIDLQSHHVGPRQRALHRVGPLRRRPPKSGDPFVALLDLGYGDRDRPADRSRPCPRDPNWSPGRFDDRVRSRPILHDRWRRRGHAARELRHPAGRNWPPGHRRPEARPSATPDGRYIVFKTSCGAGTGIAACDGTEFVRIDAGRLQ